MKTIILPIKWSRLKSMNGCNPIITITPEKLKRIPRYLHFGSNFSPNIKQDEIAISAGWIPAITAPWEDVVNFIAVKNKDPYPNIPNNPNIVKSMIDFLV